MKLKIDLIINEGFWEADQIFEDHNYNEASALNCIIYYATGNVTKEIIKNTSCILCLNALKNNQKYVDIPEAELLT